MDATFDTRQGARMTKKVSAAKSARIKKIRDAEGLSWTALGERFGISPGAAKAAYDRVESPAYPSAWKTAAARLGVTLEEYRKKREAGLRGCGQCGQWFEEFGPDFDRFRSCCVICRRNERKKTPKEKAETARATKRRREERATAHQAAKLQELTEQLKAHAAELEPAFTAVRAAELTDYSHVTIRDRLRTLEQRGFTRHTRKGWVLCMG